LLTKRSVETELVPQAGNVSFAGIDRCHDHGGIANNVSEHEDDQRDEEQDD
jgi:hypothetical protein